MLFYKFSFAGQPLSFKRLPALVYPDESLRGAAFGSTKEKPKTPPASGRGRFVI
jgi:hypothetical protein